MKILAILSLVFVSQAIWNLPSSAGEGFFPGTVEEEVAIQDPELDRAIPEPVLDRVIQDPELDRAGVADDSLRVLPPGYRKINSTVLTGREGVADDSIRILPPGDVDARIDEQEVPAWVHTWIQGIKGW